MEFRLSVCHVNHIDKTEHTNPSKLFMSDFSASAPYQIDWYAQIFCVVMNVLPLFRLGQGARQDVQIIFAV